jgi:large subunit ribosomal protein L18
MVSNKRIYVEFVDDTTGTTITSASSLRGGTTIGKTVEDARAVGTKAAEAARSKGIDKVLFDRGGHRFHGRVKAVADAMREAGLQL